MYKVHLDTITQSIALLNSNNYPLFNKSLPSPVTGPASKAELLAEPKNAALWQAVCELADKANRE